MSILAQDYTLRIGVVLGDRRQFIAKRATSLLVMASCIDLLATWELRFETL